MNHIKTAFWILGYRDESLHLGCKVRWIQGRQKVKIRFSIAQVLSYVYALLCEVLNNGNVCLISDINLALYTWFTVLARQELSRKQQGPQLGSDEANHVWCSRPSRWACATHHTWVLNMMMFASSYLILSVTAHMPFPFKENEKSSLIYVPKYTGWFPLLN